MSELRKPLHEWSEPSGDRWRIVRVEYPNGNCHLATECLLVGGKPDWGPYDLIQEEGDEVVELYSQEIVRLAGQQAADLAAVRELVKAALAHLATSGSLSRIRDGHADDGLLEAEYALEAAIAALPARYKEE